MGNLLNSAERSAEALVSLPETLVNVLKYGSIVVGAVLVLVGTAVAIGTVKGTVPDVNVKLPI